MLYQSVNLVFKWTAWSWVVAPHHYHLQVVHGWSHLWCETDLIGWHHIVGGDMTNFPQYGVSQRLIGWCSQCSSSIILFHAAGNSSPKHQWKAMKQSWVTFSSFTSNDHVSDQHKLQKFWMSLDTTLDQQANSRMCWITLENRLVRTGESYFLHVLSASNPFLW